MFVNAYLDKWRWTGLYLQGLSKNTYELAGTSIESNQISSYKEPAIGWMTAFPFATNFVGFLIFVPLRKGLLRVQGRPAVSYDNQGMVFAVAYGGLIRMFDARKFDKGPFDIYSVGGDKSDANVVKFSNDGRLMLLTTKDGHFHVLDSFRGTLLSMYNVKPVSSHATLEASFSPDGMYIVSGSSTEIFLTDSVNMGF